MQVLWDKDSCILCLRTGPLTIEHIIPQAVGGILTAPFLCKPCNDKLGARVEAAVKEDPSIQLAIEALHNRLPKLAATITEGQAYIANSPRGKVQGVLKKGGFQVRTTRDTDGSIIQPTPKGRQHIEKRLRKSGADEGTIQLSLRRFDDVPDNVPIQINEKLSVVKWSIGHLTPTLTGQLLKDEVLLKIAFEFLACHLYTAIYCDDYPLSEIRKILSGEKAAQDVQDSYRVERLHGKNYQAFHGLAFEGNKPHAIVQIRLFGWLAFRVHFLRIAVEGPRFIYTHKLDQGKDCWDRIA